MFGSRAMSSIAIGFSSHASSLSKQPKMATISCRAANQDMRKKTNNLYHVLSLESETVGVEEIKRAYRSKARQYHPDVCPPCRKEESTRMFVELHRAYETLSDPVLRRRYDSELRTMIGSEGMVVSKFPRETWEAQLCELLRRSDRREKVGCRRP